MENQLPQIISKYKRFHESIISWAQRLLQDISFWLPKLWRDVVQPEKNIAEMTTRMLNDQEKLFTQENKTPFWGCVCVCEFMKKMSNWNILEFYELMHAMLKQETFILLS